MARKVLNRKELREENDAAEEREAEEVDSDEDDGSDEDAPKKKAAKKAPAKRKSRSKTAKEIRLKAFWGVFNQSLKRVAMFEYSQRKHADKKAAELTASQKTPHFVQIVKEPIES